MLPNILLTAATIGKIIGTAGVATGGYKTVKAGLTERSAKKKHNENISRFEIHNKKTTSTMDSLGKLELEILDSFSVFSNTIEKIHNKPEFKPYNKDGISLPQYNPEEIKKVYVGAGALLGGLSGAALGSAAGFAATSATTSAVMAFGVASTGTAISSLSGVALTNATLAAIGGGTLASGGGGMALGKTVLATTGLGAGILIGGVVFGILGTKLSEKADKASAQVIRAEKEIDKICIYLKDLDSIANKYITSLTIVNAIYWKHLNGLTTIVDLLGKKDWNSFTPEEKQLTENTVLLVGLLYKMCSTPLVKKGALENSINQINSVEINQRLNESEKLLHDRGFVVSQKALIKDTCELKLFDVHTTDIPGQFRATAKIKFNPIYVGDKCALFKENKLTDRTITVSQIGIGHNSWNKKDPDRITTIFVEGNFKSYELENSIFYKV